MKAVIQADVRACDPPSLAVRVDEYTVTIAGPHTLGRLSRVDVDDRVWPCDTLKLLALPFRDREGYREEWKP